MKTNDIKLDLAKYNTNTKKEAIVIKLKKEHSEFIDQINTKSNKIRFLNDLGYNRASIAKFLNIKYQFVRNILEADRVKAQLAK